MDEQRERVSFDLETRLFRPGYMAPRPVCVSVARNGKPSALYSFEDGARYLAGALEQAALGHVLIVGQNVAYDFACLLEHAPDLAPLIWRAYDALGVHCTMTRERLIQIANGQAGAQGLSLAELAFERLGVALDKTTWRTGYEALEHLPIERWPEGARQYAINDARVTLGVWEHQEAEVTRALPQYKAWSDECGRQSAFAFALHLMGVRGIEVDQARVRELRVTVDGLLQEHSRELVREGLQDGKTGAKKLKLIRERVESSWSGEGELPRTEKGAIQTSGEVLEQCTDPALVALVAYSSAEKLSSAFVSKLEATGADPIHARYRVLGANSGRTSCSDPNVQQQPRAPGVRECFQARAGFVLIACDFDSQEMRTFAQVTQAIVGRSRLADRYREDPHFDPHTEFAAGLLKIEYAEAMRRKAAKDPELLDRRQQSKAANFGYPGGMGPASFRAFARGYGLALSLDESKAIREAWLVAWPEAREYFNAIGNWTRQGGAQIEQLYSGRLRGGCEYTQAANTLFQGLGADASKSALWEVTKRCFGAPGTEGSALFGCRPVAFVHDEIIVEAPQEYAHEAAEEIERVMIAAQEELTPDVPAAASPALMRHWSKKADAARDAAGRYICWEDR